MTREQRLARALRQARGLMQGEIDALRCAWRSATGRDAWEARKWEGCIKAREKLIASWDATLAESGALAELLPPGTPDPRD